MGCSHADLRFLGAVDQVLTVWEVELVLVTVTVFGVVTPGRPVNDSELGEYSRPWPVGASWARRRIIC